MTAVLVTGGSGYIGSQLVRHVAQQGATVTNLDRAAPAQTGPSVRAPSPAWVNADIRDLPEGLPQVDVMVHAAGIADAGTSQAFRDVNVAGTLAVMQMAADQGVRRVVMLSSIAVFGPSELPVDEASLLAPESAYGQSKVDAEAAARTVAGNFGVELVIVRPGYVFGPDHPGNFGRMVSAIRRGRLILPGREDTIKAGIYRPDLVTLLVQLTADPEPPAVVNAVYPDTPTVLAWARRLQSLLRPDRRVRVVPEGIAGRAVDGLRGLGTIAGRPGLIAVADTATKLRASSNVISRVVGTRGRPFAHDWDSAASDLFT